MSYGSFFFCFLCCCFFVVFVVVVVLFFFFFSSRRRHTRLVSDWSSDVCSSDLLQNLLQSLPYKFLPSFTKELGDRQWTISVIDNPAQVSVVASTAIAGQVYFVALDTDTLDRKSVV